MLGSSARKERKQEKKLKKKEKKGTTATTGGAETVSSVVSSADVGTHDSAQTIEAKAVVSPIPESPGVVQSKKKDALNVSADSTTKASDSSSQTPLAQKSWFQILCGTAASIAILSTGTKLLMKKEENLEVKKQDVATPAAAGGKKRRGS